MRAWHVSHAAALDERAFGSVWGNDVDGIAEIRRATPVHRARIVVDGRRMAGFAISGAGGDGGYLQRLAVDPAMQRRGIGRALVLDALHWLRRRPIDTAYVNTAVANAPALALYESLGFVRVADHLTIAELVLPA
jgi:ribosomal-protein-alanine N-acetyltransferase